MRTTLTLDPDVAERLRQETKSGKIAFKQIVNDRLRIGLGLKRKNPQKKFQVRPHHSAFRAGVDSGKLNQMIDELDAESFRERHNDSTRP